MHPGVSSCEDVANATPPRRLDEGFLFDFRSKGHRGLAYSKNQCVKSDNNLSWQPISCLRHSSGRDSFRAQFFFRLQAKLDGIAHIVHAS